MSLINLIYQPTQSPFQLAKTITRHRVKVKYTVILSFLVTSVAVPVFAEGGLNGWDSLVIGVGEEVTTAPTISPGMSGIGNYPPETMLTDLATGGAITQSIDSSASASTDLQPFVNTTWEFTSDNSLMATISCGSTFIKPLFGGGGDVMLDCTTPQKETVFITYVPETEEYFIVIYKDEFFIAKLQFVVKLQGCCRVNGRYSGNTAVASNEQLQHPASLLGARTEPPSTETNLPNPTNLPPLGQSEAIDTTGSHLPVTTVFKGGISVNKQPYEMKATQALTDEVDVMGEILVDSEHVGQSADLFVYAETTLAGFPEVMYFMLGDSLSILPWDQQPMSLVAFIGNVTLGNIQTVPMYSGYFLYSGTLKVHFGYRLLEGTVVSNVEPIDITIN